MVSDPEISGTLLARAGLNRLGYDREAFEVDGTKVRVMGLPVQGFPPALGQGAIAIECRKNDSRTASLIAAVNHAPTYQCIACERAFLNLLQADCSVPVGGYAAINPDGTLTLNIVHYTDATHCVRLHETGADPHAVAAALHARLLQASAAAPPL
jgi:hydroxymethylbilane synthase